MGRQPKRRTERWQCSDREEQIQRGRIQPVVIMQEKKDEDNYETFNRTSEIDPDEIETDRSYDENNSTNKFSQPYFEVLSTNVEGLNERAEMLVWNRLQLSLRLLCDILCDVKCSEPLFETNMKVSIWNL